MSLIAIIILEYLKFMWNMMCVLQNVTVLILWGNIRCFNSQMKFVQFLVHYLRNLPFLSFKLLGFLHVSAKFIKSLKLWLHCYSVLYMFLNKTLRIILQACFWIELLYNSFLNVCVQYWSFCYCCYTTYSCTFSEPFHITGSVTIEVWEKQFFSKIHPKKYLCAYFLQRNGDSLVDYLFPILFNCYKSYYCAYVSLILAWVFDGNSAILEEHLNTNTCYKCLFFFLGYSLTICAEDSKDKSVWDLWSYGSWMETIHTKNNWRYWTLYAEIIATRSSVLCLIGTTSFKDNHM